MFDEMKQHAESGGVGGFLPAAAQICNVARYFASSGRMYCAYIGLVCSLPGIVGASVGLPDVHSGNDILVIEWLVVRLFSVVHRLWFCDWEHGGV